MGVKILAGFYSNVNNLHVWSGKEEISVIQAHDLDKNLDG